MGGNDGPSNTEPNHHNKRKQQNGVGGSNGFKSLGLSETVYKGIVKLGFRVRLQVFVCWWQTQRRSTYFVSVFLPKRKLQ